MNNILQCRQSKHSMYVIKNLLRLSFSNYSLLLGQIKFQGWMRKNVPVALRLRERSSALPHSAYQDVHTIHDDLARISYALSWGHPFLNGPSFSNSCIFRSQIFHIWLLVVYYCSPFALGCAFSGGAFSFSGSPFKCNSSAGGKSLVSSYFLTTTTLLSSLSHLLQCQTSNLYLLTYLFTDLLHTHRWRSLASVWRSTASCSRLRTNSCLADLSSLISASMTSRLPWHAHWHDTDVTSCEAVTLKRSEVWLAENWSRGDLSFPLWKPVKFTQLTCAMIKLAVFGQFLRAR